MNALTFEKVVSALKNDSLFSLHRNKAFGMNDHVIRDVWNHGSFKTADVPTLNVVRVRLITSSLELFCGSRKGLERFGTYVARFPDPLVRSQFVPDH